MTLGPRLRRIVLTTHVIASVGWIGALAAYGTLVVAALTSDSDETIRAAFVAMALVYYALVPLAAVGLLTGLAQSLGSSWGLLRHYWVLTKFVVTMVAITVMVLNLDNVRDHADQVTGTHVTHMSGVASHQLRHVIGGMAILLLAAILGKYKPKGLTRHGRRRKDAPRGRPAEKAPPANRRTPTSGGRSPQCPVAGYVELIRSESCFDGPFPSA
jgi:hypothetical protein